MRTVSVINYKGGVGKTTLTANLGAELAFRNYRVLLLDMDPQASLTFSFVPPDEWRERYEAKSTIKRWYDVIQTGETFPLTDLIVSPAKVRSSLRGRGKLDLICSNLGLLQVDLELATELGGANLRQVKANYLKVHRRLQTGLAELSADQYDLILIDCPPNFNIVTCTAIAASTDVLIPAKPDYLSTLGIDYLQKSLRNFVENYNDMARIDDGKAVSPIDPKILGVVFTMVQYYGGEPISSVRPFMQEVRNLKLPVFADEIRENKTIFSDAPVYGVPVVLNNYSGETYRNVVEGLESIVNEFEKRLGLTRRP